MFFFPLSILTLILFVYRRHDGGADLEPGLVANEISPSASGVVTRVSCFDSPDLSNLLEMFGVRVDSRAFSWLRR
eukprot:m.845955 g.845955  ORF g.845955 m.845955 type:complete len:75 (-) comp59554_c0_seq31:3714-3938(-)